MFRILVSTAFTLGFIFVLDATTKPHDIDYELDMSPQALEPGETVIPVRSEFELPYIGQELMLDVRDIRRYYPYRDSGILAVIGDKDTTDSEPGIPGDTTLPDPDSNGGSPVDSTALDRGIIVIDPPPPPTPDSTSRKLMDSLSEKYRDIVSKDLRTCILNLFQDGINYPDKEYEVTNGRISIESRDTVSNAGIKLISVLGGDQAGGLWADSSRIGDQSNIYFVLPDSNISTVEELEILINEATCVLCELMKNCKRISNVECD